jgi:hypothetical protein
MAPRRLRGAVDQARRPRLDRLARAEPPQVLRQRRAVVGVGEVYQAEVPRAESPAPDAEQEQVVPRRALTARDGHPAAAQVAHRADFSGIEKIQAREDARPVTLSPRRGRRDNPQFEFAVEGVKDRGRQADCADVETVLCQEHQRLGAGGHALEFDFDPLLAHEPVLDGDIERGEVDQRDVRDHDLFDLRR